MFFDKFRDFIASLLESEKHSLIHFVPVCIGCGICRYFYLDNEPDLLKNLLVAVLMFFGIFTTKYKKLFMAMFFVVLGVCLAQLRTMTVNTPMLAEKIEDVEKFRATIDSCEKTPTGMRFLVSDIEKFNFNKMILTWRTNESQNYEPGNRVIFRARIYPLNSQYFPLAYDFKRQQYFRGISAQGFLSGPPKVISKNPKMSLGIFVEKIRHKINKKIEERLSGNAVAITKALITGEKSDISQDVRTKFVNSGTAHLLAISGLHMGIIGFFIFWLFRLLMCCVLCVSQYHDVKKIAAIISLIFVIFYLYISGCSVPSIRAFIMHSLIIVGILCNRVALSMRSIAIAATIILVFSPEVITFPGFQMSFSAVIAIVALYENREQLGRQKFIFGIILTTLAASIPTSLFSMFSFNQLTLNNILANVVCIPLMTFVIMPLAVISLFLMCFTTFPIVFVGKSVDMLIDIVTYASTLPGSHFTMPTPTPLTMIIFIFSGLVLTLVHHKIRFIGVLGIFCGVICYCLQPVSDIFVSPYGTIVGFRTKNCACFNKLNHFRSMGTAWAKSIGLDKKANFHSKSCKQYAQIIDENQYILNMNGQQISIGENNDSDIVLDSENPFAQLIYLPNFTMQSNSHRKRPWS